MADVNISVYDAGSITEDITQGLSDLQASVVDSPSIAESVSSFIIQNGLIISVPFFNSGTGDGIAPFTCSRASSVTGVDTNGQIVTYNSNELSFNRGMLQKNPASGYSNHHKWSYDVTHWVISHLVSGSLVSDPAGTTLGYPFIANTDNSTHQAFYQYINTLDDDSRYCFSVFIKPGTVIGNGNDVLCQVFLRNKAGHYNEIVVNLDSKSIVSMVGDSVLYNYGFEDYIDNWIRCWFIIDSESGSSLVTLSILLYDTTLGSPTFTGDGTTIGLWSYGAQVNEGEYPLPLIVTNGSVGTVAAETISANISSNPTLTDILGNGTSIGTMLCKIVPKCDFADYTGAYNIVSVREGTGILNVSNSQSDFYSWDGSSIAYGNTSDTDPLKDSEQLVVVRWSDSTSLFQLSTSDDGGATWYHGSAVSYDGAFVLGSSLYIGYNNEYPFLVQNLRFYTSWIADADLSEAAGFSQIDVSDTSAITDVTSLSLSDLTRSIFDTISVQDVVNTALVNTISVNDLVSTVESIVLLENLNPSVYDSISITENTQISFDSYISVFDSTVLSEDVNLLSELNPFVYNTVSTEDLVNVTLINNISVYSSSSLTDVVTTALVNCINVFDSVSLLEDLQFSWDSFISVYDTVRLVDVVSFGQPPYFEISVYDSVKLTESFINTFISEYYINGIIRFECEALTLDITAEAI